MSDEDYRNLAFGDNSGNSVTVEIKRDLTEGGWLWCIKTNGSESLSGWCPDKRTAREVVQARIQRLARTNLLETQEAVNADHE